MIQTPYILAPFSLFWLRVAYFSFFCLFIFFFSRFSSLSSGLLSTSAWTGLFFFFLVSSPAAYPSHLALLRRSLLPLLRGIVSLIAISSCFAAPFFRFSIRASPPYAGIRHFPIVIAPRRSSSPANIHNIYIYIYIIPHILISSTHLCFLAWFRSVALIRFCTSRHVHQQILFRHHCPGLPRGTPINIEKT